MTLADLIAEYDRAVAAEDPGQQQQRTQSEQNAHLDLDPLDIEMAPNTAMNFGGDDPDGAFVLSKTFSLDQSADAGVVEDAILSESPRTVADMDAFLCGRVSAAVLPSPPLVPDHYEEGTVDVKRCARKRRIRSGSICGPPSGGGDGSKSYKLSYRIYRPELLGSTERAPILALHGGPSLPSQYLHPIAEHFPDRSVIFYDQLGCGKSSSPPDVGLYSLSKSIDDLEALLLALKMKRFHLLGHSFGGVLAFEYCKKIVERAGREEPGWRDDPEVLSLTLSNSFTCAKLCDTERERLLGPIASRFGEGDEEGADNEFWRQHQCRLPSTPPALDDALGNWGVAWHERASSPLSAYTATAPSRWASALPPALILRGEHDFVTPACVKAWRESVWNHQDVAEATLEGCAHYCHLEDKVSFGALVGGFCKERDH